MNEALLLEMNLLGKLPQQQQFEVHYQSAYPADAPAQLNVD